MEPCEIPIAVKTCTGKTGPANELTVGDVETLPPGSDVEVTITGDPPSQVLNIGIPSGPPGADGAPGGSDAAMAGWINDPESETRAALDDWLDPPLTDRLYISARDYGVIGDGVADDHAAMTLALSVAIGSKLVLDSGPLVRVSAPISVPSDTRLDLNGRTLVRAYDGSPDGDGTAVIRMRDVRNVTIENGFIDGNGDEFPNGSTGYNLTAGFGVTDITYRSVTFRHVINNHAIDLTDSDNVRILDCNFYGFRNVAARAFSEAIQIDPNGVSGTGGTNRNWLVQGCTFGASDIDPVSWGPYGGGIGNHAAHQTSVTERIRITHNLFQGMTVNAVRLHAMSRVTVTDNNFVDCALGIVSEPNSGFPDPSADAARGYGVVITGNTFESELDAGHRGIRLDWTDSFAITGNTFLGGHHAMQLRFCRAGTVSGNSITYTASHGLLVNESGYGAALPNLGHTCDIVLTGNQIKYAGASGIFLQGARRCLVSGNTLMAGSQITVSAAVTLDRANSTTVNGNFNSQSVSPNQDSWGLLNMNSSPGIVSQINRWSGANGGESL